MEVPIVINSDTVDTSTVPTELELEQVLGAGMERISTLRDNAKSAVAAHHFELAASLLEDAMLRLAVGRAHEPVDPPIEPA